MHIYMVLANLDCMWVCHIACMQVSDMKLKGPSFETLTIIAEAVGPQFVGTMLHKKAAAHKNPKVCVKECVCLCDPVSMCVHVLVNYSMCVCVCVCVCVC